MKKILILLILFLELSQCYYAYSEDKNTENCSKSSIYDYKDILRDKILDNFIPPPSLLKKLDSIFRIKLKLNQDGSLDSFDINNDLGVKGFDEEFKIAVKSAQPFPIDKCVDLTKPIEVIFLPGYIRPYLVFGTPVKSQPGLNRKIFQDYHKEVSKKVGNNFKPPHFGTNKYASVRFLISEEGKVKDLEIIESSESEKFDEKCKEAVLNSEPFPKPPIKDLAINYSFSKKSPLNGFPIIIPIPIPLH
jgi:TonB family protein